MALRRGYRETGSSLSILTGYPATTGPYGDSRHLSQYECVRVCVRACVCLQSLGDDSMENENGFPERICRLCHFALLGVLLLEFLDQGKRQWCVKED